MTNEPEWGSLQQEDTLVGGECSIDSINGVQGATPGIKVRKKKPLIISGWSAISTKEGILASHLTLALKAENGKSPRRFAKLTRVKRKDVADYFGNNKIEDSGFKAIIKLANVKEGKYIVELIQHINGKNYVCSSASTIKIK